MIREIPLAERVSNVERDARDHAKTITEQNNFLRTLDLRVGDIEEARAKRALDEVRKEERDDARFKAIDVRLLKIEESCSKTAKGIESIQSLGVRVVLIILTAVIGGIVTYFVKMGGP